FSNLLSVALLTIFCLRFAQRRWRVFERIVWVCAIALLPVFYISTWFGTAYLGYLPEVTEFSHQIFNVFIVVALVAVMLRVKEDGGFESWLLLLGALSFSGPRLIAWVGVNDRTTLDPLSLTPPSILAFVFIAGWILIERFVRTAREFETLNAQLELRVGEKSRELHAQLSATETAREEAERANLAKSRFLAAASHDLRQPLHALGLFASALNEKSHDPESRNLVAHINQSIGALGTLFNSVLDVSKLDARAVSPNIRNIELQRIFERIGDELWPDAGSKQLRLRMVRTRLVVRSDPVLLERILRNLVHNAIRYTSQGGVVVGARRCGSRANLEVWDTGIGIAVEEQARIFEEFYQVGNPERDRSQGLGLGLAIVKRLSDLLDHPLFLRSTPGRGSLFRLSMEIADSPADVEPSASQPAAEIGNDLLEDKCIMIIDDEPSVRKGMFVLLASWRCDVMVAADEGEAVAKLESIHRKPDMLIVDYRLRDRVSGIDVIDALRTRFGREVPALIVSGESSADELARIRTSGLPMLHKPVLPAKLRSMMFYLLTRSDVPIQGA
ncbi:MAG: hybrid sensor histidine kinase/response regulator, partial [Betaproteobacteria bacterium]